MLSGAAYASRLGALTLAIPLLGLSTSFVTKQLGAASGYVLVPLVMLVLVILAGVIVGRRLRGLGASGWLVLALAPMLFRDLGPLLTLFEGFRQRDILLAMPWRMIAAVGTLVFLGLHADYRPLWELTIGKCVAGLAFLVLLLGALTVTGSGAGLLQSMACLILSASYVAILWRQHDEPVGGELLLETALDTSPQSAVFGRRPAS